MSRAKRTRFLICQSGDGKATKDEGCSTQLPVRTHWHSSVAPPSSRAGSKQIAAVIVVWRCACACGQQNRTSMTGAHASSGRQRAHAQDTTAAPSRHRSLLAQKGLAPWSSGPCLTIDSRPPSGFFAPLQGCTTPITHIATGGGTRHKSARH
jgi:hypothetical protein